MMIISAHTSLILIALIIIILVTKSEAEPRSQVIKIACDRQKLYNQTFLIPNFVGLMGNVGEQIVSSRDGSSIVGTGANGGTFALAQCYGDLSSDDCLRCYTEARTILPTCFPDNGGRIYLDGCYMRFQKYRFFDEYTGPNDTIVCGNTIRKGRKFEGTVRQAVFNAVTDSLRDYKKGYFAREDILVPGNGNTSVYVMAQCWKTLIPDLCRACLMNASASITKCLPWSEGRALNTGCFMRYSDTNFLNPLPVVTSSSSNTADGNRNSLNKKKKSHLSVILPIVFTLVVFSFTLIVYAWGKKKKSHRKAQVNKDQKQDSDLPFFSLNEVVKATRSFSTDNKLGQGGFGAVYKGVLKEGGEIAVKRLSKTSRQGLPEFQNEVTCIAKLQHRNLVKLLGCCVQGEEMMLIYEYMPNKSLDSFLFDKNHCVLLDWPQRYHIINGIARGLLYLHQDSRHRIIHRDLKASNILLDSNMNPKISDFGLARMFDEYETEANTNKVVGTLGYISPEYAANGLFSVKSDVFSFGVLVLEIVSGKKNRGFSHQSHHDNLLGHAWRLYKEAKPLELVDAALGDSLNVSEVLQSIHVGLSCVQQQADDRPYMSSVVHMLGGEGAMPIPKHPGFFTDSTLITPPHVSVSINEATLSQLDAR